MIFCLTSHKIFLSEVNMDDVMNKFEMSEEDIRMRFITPAIIKGGWNLKQIKAEYTFTDGKIIVRGNIQKRGERKRADYLLYYRPNIPIAIVEAKDNKHSVGDGIQQGISYAQILDVPFVYSSNGDGFIEHDMTEGKQRELPIDEFPSPEELWDRLCKHRNISDEKKPYILEPYHFQAGDKIPRYYQRNAINRTVEAVVNGQKRILIVMATGTGKTYTAFQIIHRLHKSGLKKKILYLADRNILIDQTMSQDFRPFEKIMTKVDGKKLDSSYEIYMSLYQQLAGDDQNEPFRAFKPNFFDLIIIDECHRGSAKADSAWRKILDYFKDATHIGMTATPKETKEVSNLTYFGEPIYTYSLKQGIEDGFLAPYKVIRVGLNVDLQGYRPEAGKKDIYDEEIEDREYNIKDFDKNIVIDERTKAVAKFVSDFLKRTNRFDKTIVFCIDIEHAERMCRALINENSDLVKENPKYVMRITGDNPEGKKQLDNFIDVGSKYPTIVTTSKLMTTGVDCKTCKVIVLENNINSMTEFKQIIGRGTRIKEEAKKTFFTIIDFRNASRLFADPDFDGEPVVVIEPDSVDGGTPEPPRADPIGPQETPPPDVFTDPPISGEPHRKVYVKGVQVYIGLERVQYYGNDGKLITESLRDYSKRNILNEYATLDEFLAAWNGDKRKQAIIDELQNHGVLLESLESISGKQDLDAFDLICHIAYDKPALSKSDRVNNVKKKGYLYKYSGLAQQVLEALLEKYMNDGIFASIDMENTKILDNDPFNRLGSPVKIAQAFGGKNAYLKAIKELQLELYAA